MVTAPTIVPLAQVLPGAVPLSAADKGVNESYIGLIRTGAANIKAYIKVLTGRELVNELLGSVIGRSLGLAVPRPYLCVGSTTDLPESALLASHSGKALLFACEALPHPDLSRRFKPDLAQLAAWMMQNWPEWRQALLFDEWLANVDRNWRNLLLGSDGRVWLIDHGRILTGPGWQVADLKADQMFLNKLAGMLLDSLSLPDRVGLISSANAMSTDCTSMNLGDVISASRSDQLIPPTEQDAVVSFLSNRILLLSRLVSSRVGIPMIGGLT